MKDPIKSQKLWFLLNRFDRSKEEELRFFDEDKKKYPFFYLLDWNERFNKHARRMIALKSSHRNQLFTSIFDIEDERQGNITSTALNQDQLIDQFLENLPSLSRLKKVGPEEPEVEIDLSESNWNLPTSETFAMILENRENTSRQLRFMKN